jgi:DHA1 family bicyclomycin/chloramphenicol resistance-like MFS transporter
MKNKYWLAAIAMFIVPISGVGVDIYVPSLPDVSHFFGVHKSWAQFSVAIYIIGLGIMQFFAGTLSDSFGRKKPFYVAMIIFLFATLFIPQAQNIYQLLAMRLIQGFMAAIVIVPMRAVLADLFDGHEFKKIINYMTMCWSMGPIIAPAIGGYLQHLFGWQACFYFLAGYSFLALLLVFFFLPETSKVRHPFEISPIMQRYQEILTHRKYNICILLNGILYGMVLMFAVVGPFLIQEVLHYSAVDFGHIALLTGLAWFLGAMTNRFLIHVPFTTKAKYCFWAMLCIALISLVLTHYLPLSLYLVVIPVLILFWVGGTEFPNNFAEAVGLFPHISGSANALFGGFVFLISGMGSLIGIAIKSTSSMPLMIAYTILISLCLVIYYTGLNNKS